jgi:hypothetical protein
MLKKKLCTEKYGNMLKKKLCMEKYEKIRQTFLRKSMTTDPLSGNILSRFATLKCFSALGEAATMMQSHQTQPRPESEELTPRLEVQISVAEEHFSAGK